MIVPKAAEERDGGTGLQDHVDFGGSQFQGCAFNLLSSFVEAVHGDIMKECARFDEADAFGHGAAPFLSAHGFRRGGDASDLCAPAVHDFLRDQENLAGGFS